MVRNNHVDNTTLGQQDSATLSFPLLIALKLLSPVMLCDDVPVNHQIMAKDASCPSVLSRYFTGPTKIPVELSMFESPAEVSIFTIFIN